MIKNYSINPISQGKKAARFPKNLEQARAAIHMKQDSNYELRVSRNELRVPITAFTVYGFHIPLVGRLRDPGCLPPAPAAVAGCEAESVSGWERLLRRQVIFEGLTKTEYEHPETAWLGSPRVF